MSEGMKKRLWFDYKLEHDPRFLARVERARQAFREGKGIRIEDIRLDDVTGKE